MPGCSSYLAAGVCACTAEVEIADRCTVVRPTGERTLCEVLAGNDVKVTDVSIGETDPPFQVNGCKQRPVNNNIAEIRRVGGEGIDQTLHRPLPDVHPMFPPVDGQGHRAPKST